MSVQHGGKIRAMNTEMLRDVFHWGRRDGYNRVVDQEWEQELALDPDGTHVVAFSMIHEHINGVRVDPHIRAVILCKREFEIDPVEVTVDMSIETFEALPVIAEKDARKAVEEFPD